ncbi:glycosyl hydrolase [Halobacillus andaensis]|uniref:4,4'-diaponeurosporenoate glycosyltransferase n=1 Tax=Halobacillus andaensis TaxID=1176239 RepID=A0A917B0A0_HALAA|nr:glycosyltransferase family 2 protein [Halobacillus andaensis]MBP2003689.1 cellulose synthase/poly-beta-1,6-N-acetylglucosamine synthase-like glycosyltransferase [Halobacillus andaensis]GGF12494.1 glycosyl hydrolase [Halobacillus andaensis]
MLLTIALLMTILLNVWTIANSFFLPNLQKETAVKDRPKVSLLVPLRDEIEHVTELIRCLKAITYANVEFILLDDHSEDGTYEALLNETSNDPRFIIIQGHPLPEGWNGKVHACHQLSQHASGDYYLFLDADARVSPSIIERSLATLQKRKASMLSGFPHYPNHHVLSHLLVPLQHMVVFLHLPLAVANFTRLPAFTAACGIFIFIERKAYDAIGGHQAVKGSLVEDVHIAREVKKHGFSMILCNITDGVVSYMYDSSKETWEGFKKNIYTGIGRSPVMVVFLTSLYIGLFLFPFALGVYGIVSGQTAYFLPFLLTVTFKMYVDARTRHPLWLSWLLPFSAALLIALLFASMMVHLRGKSYQWKGRSYE